MLASFWGSLSIITRIFDDIMVLIFTQENDEWVRHDSGETHALGEAIFGAINVPYDDDDDDEPIRSLFDNATGEKHGKLVKALNSLWFQDCGVSCAEKVPEDKFSPLHVACSHLRPQLVAFLVSKGANVKAKSTLSGCTPLHILVETKKHYALSNRLKIIKVLLESLPEPQDRIALMNQQDSFKNSILHLVPLITQLDLCLYLANQPGINWSLQNCDGWTPFHFYCEENRMGALVERLSKVDPAVFSLVTHEGDTCLHFAARAVAGIYYVNPTLIEWLLSKMSREDISKQNSRGQTAWDIISLSLNERTPSLFVKRFSDEHIGRIFEYRTRTIRNSTIMIVHMNDPVHSPT
ncbi:ankyrin [Pyrenochaeta sp. DS3sAY3a]|nr:ankyrin [Pyrenochaeta sp. DS3sAY3a]